MVKCKGRRGFLPWRCLALGLCLMLAGCAQTPGAPVQSGDFSAPQTLPDNAPTGYSLLLALPGLDGMAAPGLSRGVQDYCDELSIEVTVDDCGGDAAAQYEAIETFVTAGVDAVLCWPVEPAGIGVYFDSARQHDTATLAFGAASTGADATLLCDGWGGELAGAAAVFMEEKMRYSGTALLLEAAGPTALPGFGASAAAQLAQLDPELEVVRAGGVSPNEVADLLAENPDARLILCGSAALAQAVYAALAAPAGDDTSAETGASSGLQNVDLSGYFIAGPAAPGEGEAFSAAVEIDFAQAGRDWVDMAIAAIEGGAVADKAVGTVLVQPVPEDDLVA